MNIRKWLYFTLFRLRGITSGIHYERFWREYQDGIPSDTTSKSLIRLLKHCKQSVPNYREVMNCLDDSFYQNPFEYLQQLPILSRESLRDRLDELKSIDLSQRKWFMNHSGGSTGEPVHFIQDLEFASHAGAITLLFSNLVGHEIGNRNVYLWGSTRDITGGTEPWRARLINNITNTSFINVMRLSPQQMREIVSFINNKRPNLIVAYVGAIYDLARFAEREKLNVIPQSAVITSAGALYPFMREKIEQVFQCKVYNRYGSREVGDVACERPGQDGLWVAPWGNYVEIVDEKGIPVPDGTEGEILVTSLSNYAMPLIRYRIGDRGLLAPCPDSDTGKGGQILQDVTGRISDVIRTKDGNTVSTHYFGALLMSFHKWIGKYQVIQKNFSSLIIKVVKLDEDDHQADINEIRAKTRLAMGDDCEVIFEVVDDIPASSSGKYRYIRSEILEQG